ncbi:MAG: hypothetical protein KF855_18225 [Acidobacteria bacterium]|nr:hypothetical protein [Acidobacteriota bacterium]
MNTNAKIKIIKKGDVAAQKKELRPDVRTKRETAREMVSTVTNWVSDLQARKRDETKMAIEQLFGQQPQPTES